MREGETKGEFGEGVFGEPGKYQKGAKGGGGSGTQKFMYQKWPCQIFPLVNFVFSHNGCLGLGGFKWSGCSVRIRLWLRLPHSFHRLLSIVSASGASSGAMGLFTPVPCFHAVLWPYGLYRVMRTSWSVVTPSQRCCCWLHSAPHGQA